MATRKLLVHWNFNQYEIQNAVVQNLGADPGSPVNGQFWYLTTGSHDIRARVNGASVSLLPTSLLGSANTWTAAQIINAAITGNNTINLTGTGASSVGGTMGATAFVPTGLTGSVAASRYVGATATGAPSTGAHLVGDYVIAQDGHIWVCTGAGTPGTWADVAGSGFPGYGAVTAQTAFGGASANGVATTVSRSDHTHGTPTHTITDHSAYRLDQFTAPNTSLSMGSQKITSLLDGTAATDAVNLGQVQGLIATGTNKTAVRAASTANGALATAYENGDSLDGVTLATGDRILLKNQTTGSENGIYTVNASGAPTRATDADISAEVKGGLSVWVNEGTTNADTRWVLTTNDPITLGTTALVFTQDFAASATTAGNGLTATGNVLAVGAGTGILSNANDVAIDTSLVVRKTTALIGNGAATSIAVTHSFGNQWPQAQVIEVATGDLVECEIDFTDANNTTFNFNAAPASNAIRVTIHG